MKKWLAALAAFLCAALVLTGCAEDAPPVPEGKLSVVASFYPIKEFAEAVGGDKVYVTTLIPDGVEPHDFQPAPKHLKGLLHARLFLINGLGMEPWAEEIVEAVGNPSLVLIDASQGIEPIPAGSRGRFDPHCWLSLSAAQTEVMNIAEAFAAADPTNADFYRQNAASYNGRLQSLLNEYRAKTAALPQRRLVTSHAAFAYLCRDLDLVQESVAPVFAAGEPSPQQLARLAALCRTWGVHTIFTEHLASPEIARTLSRETGASLAALSTLESKGHAASYIEGMQADLEILCAGLQ